MLEPPMCLLRTEPELVPKSRWAVPETLTGAGFAFEHPRLASRAPSGMTRSELWVGSVQLVELRGDRAEVVVGLEDR